MTPTKIDTWYADHADAIRGTAWAVATLLVLADVAVLVLALTPMH